MEAKQKLEEINDKIFDLADRSVAGEDICTELEILTAPEREYFDAIRRFVFAARSYGQIIAEKGKYFANLHRAKKQLPLEPKP